MDSSEALKRISEIIFSVPGEVYKFIQPEECFAEEWQEAYLHILLISEYF